MMLSREEIKKIDPAKLKKVHIIGIVSPFHSFCGKTLMELGVEVTASEYVLDHPDRKKWEDMGVLYPGGHDEKYVTDDIDLIVYPNGPIPGNPECEKAEKLGISAVTVGQMVGVLSRGYKTIAVAGTHGKTTTTSLIVWTLNELDKLPNFLVGDADDKILGINKNWNVNKNCKYLVVEACEYKKQFLDRAPEPYISVITNIGLDHTDCYPDQKSYNAAFIKFIKNTKFGVVIDTEGENEGDILDGVRKDVSDIKVFDIAEFRKKCSRINCKLVGDHNQENSLRALTLGVALGFNESEVLGALASFPGVTKRFELVGETKSGNPVHHDFAHNPEKVEACIQGAKEAYPGKKVIFVFQPHSHERSYSLRDGFAESIKEADVVIIPNIFSPKRETEEQRAMISAEDFTKLLKDSNPEVEVIYGENLEKTVDLIKKYEGRKESVIVLASAGDLPKIIPDLLA